MKSHALYILSSFLLITVVACNQIKPMKVGALTLSSSKPYLGEKITFQYKSDSTRLAGLKNLEGTLYYVVNTKLYANSMAMADSNGIWHGSFVIPDSAQAFGIKFFGDNQKDTNHGKGYMFPVYSRSGNINPGAYAAESIFYNGIGSHFLGLEQNPNAALTLLHHEFELYPNMKKQWQSTYLTTLLAAQKDSAFPEIESQIKKMLSGKDLKEKDYMTAYSLYTRMRMKPQADSLKKVVIMKFPHGELAQNEKAIYFEKQKSLDTQITLYNQFKQEFPTTKPNGITASIESFMLSNIAIRYAAKKQYDKFMQYAGQITNKENIASIYNNTAWGLVQKGENLAFADSISKTSLDIMQQLIKNVGGNKPTYYTNKDWMKLLQSNYGNYADTYGTILAKKGEYKKALPYEKMAVKYTNEANTGINTKYVEFLMKTGHTGTAKTAAEKFINDGKSSPKMIDYLKTIYIKENGSSKGLNEYLSSMVTEANNKLKAKLKREIIDKPAPNFDLTDLKGNHISLSSLRGKVVVMDFWATWCGPCKASFPAMQKAVNQFKGDKNVAFLFVDTWEHTKPAVRFKQVTDFITKHKYPFHVLLDKRQPKDSTQYQIVSDYGVNGIPTKFIIDPKGNIRFKSVGYMGDMNGMVKEVSEMIAMAKAN